MAGGGDAQITKKAGFPAFFVSDQMLKASTAVAASIAVSTAAQDEQDDPDAVTSVAVAVSTQKTGASISAAGQKQQDPDEA